MMDDDPTLYLLPKGSVSGILWPRLPSANQAVRFALLYQFDRSQWWSAEALQTWQLRQARLLLVHALAKVPYYRERLPATGFRKEEALTQEVWQGLPILTRENVLDFQDDLKAEELPRGHGRVSERTSSGSTGRPVRVRKTQLSQLFWHACTERDSLWHGRDMTKTIGLIRTRNPRASYPKGLEGNDWGDTIFASGRGAMLRIDTPVEQQAEWLLRLDPDYLQTSPINLGVLLEYCRKKDLRPAKLRGVSTFAGAVSDELRQACRELWGVKIADLYSAEETGYMALQCPEYDHYHVQSESVIVEIVDEDGRPCAPGEQGRVLVTPLHNFAMPLVRYDVGDFAVPGPPCPCGRGLPVIERIIGRIRNMLTLPDGSKIAPAFVNDLARDFPVAQFQIAQLAPDRLEARIVPHGSFGPDEERRFAEEMQSRLPAAYGITFSYLKEIPRSPNGKYMDFKSEIAESG